MTVDEPTGLRQARLREGLLLLGFVLLCVAAAFTVLLPETAEDPEPSTGGAGQGAEASAATARP